MLDFGCIFRLMGFHNEKFRGTTGLQLFETLIHVVLRAAYLIGVGHWIAYQIYKTFHVNNITITNR